MDRVITPRFKRWQLILAGSLAVLVAIVVLVQVVSLVTATSISRDDLRIGTTNIGNVESFIPVRAQVIPQQTTLLDAIEGGRVEAIFAQSGDVVSKDQLIMRLSNSPLRLEVVGREADIARQLNASRTLELDLRRSKLNVEREIIEADYQITRLSARINRRADLVEDGAEAEEIFEELRSDLRYWRSLHENLEKSLLIEEEYLIFQIETTQSDNANLQSNLEIAKRSLDALDVKAPIEGRLTAFSTFVGENLLRGERVGRIDGTTGFKLEATVDQQYLQSLQPGLDATMGLNEETFQLKLDRVLPEVVDGQFKIELSLVDETIPSLRRGQNVIVQIALNDSNGQTKIAPLGPWLQETGGNWVFVISRDGRSATRRTIQPGRRTAAGLEVIGGLDGGEQIIVSSYEAFANVDHIAIRL